MVHMAVKKRAPRKTTKKSTTLDARGQILKFATQLLAEKGPFGFTLAALEEHTGFSKSHIRYYFPDLRQLALQSIRNNLSRAQTQTQKRVERRQTLPERLLEIYDSAIFLHRADDHFAPLFLQLISQSSVDADYRALFYAWTSAAETRIERLLLEELRNVVFPEIQVLARSLHDLILGASIKSVLASRPGELTGIREALSQSIHRLTPPLKTP